MSDYPPRLYELLHTGNAGDERFYEDLCAGAKSVLELGCGGGRISSRLVRLGLSVTGIDSNPLMIEAARERIDPAGAFAGVVADMRSFDLSRAFDRIIAPYNGILCLLSDADAAACFERVERHLADGGIFAFDIYLAGDDPEPCLEEEHLVSVEDRGEVFHVFERDISGGVSRRFDVEYIYRKVVDEGFEEVRFAIPQRSYDLPQLWVLLEANGLEITKVFPDFEEGESDGGTTRIAVVVSKKIAG